ncbi:MAG TPA: condensation domain-containing protein, partial [Longimicrobiaceae bacterium]|nr:condensation domain-containing protein [Longimicrobiaceae bacterium]
LPAPAPAAPDGADAVPGSAVAEVLAGIGAVVLGVARVGVAQSFFELGGHSLLASRVTSRARQAFGVELPLRAIFDAPTVAAMAARIEELRSAGTSPALPMEHFPPDEVDELPVSFAQQRLWLVDRLEPNRAAYNMPYALRLRGAPDVGALRASLDALVERHETLCTVFADRDGTPVQVIHPPAPVPLPVIDLGGLPAGAREPHAARLAREEALRPFDLARGPLLRCTLLRLGEADHVLCFTLHHVVSDGWSMDVLVREVSTLYAAFERGEEPRLPELPVQYADYAVWQRRWLSGAVLEEHLDFWRTALRGAPPLLEVPTDHPRAAGQGTRAGGHLFALPAELSRGLRALAEREGATLFMTLLAGWQVLLGRWAGQEDVVLGTPVAGRTRRETEGLIGFFVNMLPLRTDLSGDPTWSELLGRVREAALRAYEHQELPFEKLVEELGVERSLTHPPVFQAVFALERSGAHGKGLKLGGLELEPFGGGEAAAKFELELTVDDSGDGLAAALVYRRALFEPDTAARMADHLVAVLEAMAAAPERRISGVALLPGPQRALGPAGRSAAASGLPAACVHELFAEQARRTPDAVAVVAGGESLTYAALERGANQLAHALRRLGVGPETCVGLCVRRSPEMLVGVLGIWKAGGVHVPLDPADPAERRGYMLRAAAAPGVV